MDIISLFFGLFGLMLITNVFFYFNRNSGLKRKLYPLASMVIGILMTTIISMLISASIQMVMIMLVFVLIANYVGYRQTKFCDSCGRTFFPNQDYWNLKFCPKCGAKF